MKDYSLNKSKIRINISEVDFNAKLRLDNIFNIMQNEALKHSEKIGVGFKSYMKKNQTWVLTWAKIKIIEYPTFEDEIEVNTWLKRTFKLYTLRDFAFYDKNGNNIINASTGWLLLNISNLRPLRLENIPDTVVFLENRNAINELPDKISINKELKIRFEKTVFYSDLDMNFHVNNSRYIEYILNSFPIDDFRNKEIKEITLYFISDARINESIQVYTDYKKGDNIIQCEIRNKSRNSIILKSIIDFK